MAALHLVAAAATVAAVAAGRSSSAEAASSSLLPWPWSWDTLQAFAFPGAANRFMTPDELTHFGGGSFANLLIWGLNASCVSADGTTTPAICPAGASHTWCDEAHPENQTFALTMETSLQEQGARLKAQNPSLPVLGYIEGLSAQQSYAAQAKLLYDPAYAPMRLSVASKGLIDCFRDGCNWQGVEYRQYDLRQPAALDYYVYEVVGTLLNSTSLDGTFLDVIEWWIDACGQWGCTAQETEDLTNATLAAADAVFAAAASWGKVVSMSSHTYSASSPDYYSRILPIYAKHSLKGSNSAIRFWEFWKADESMLTSLINEVSMGVAQHVHADDRTMTPDWSELAVFLLGMGEQCWFSQSGPWMLDSFSVWPEYTRPLGAPLGPAAIVSYNQSVPAWGLIEDQNFVYGWPSGPNASIPGKLQWLGHTNTSAECVAACQALPGATAMSWAGTTGDEWALGCWARLDAFDAQACLISENAGPPCYSAAEPGLTSAAAQPLLKPVRVWSRSFEHLNVTWRADTGEAHLNWAADSA